MNLKIINIQNRGDHTKEYVMLQALDDCLAHNYIVFDSTYTTQGQPSNLHRHSYWFPSGWEFKKGEVIFLYTSRGANRKFVYGGKIYHSFYWNANSAIWNDERDFATLVYVINWSFTPVRS